MEVGCLLASYGQEFKVTWWLADVGEDALNRSCLAEEGNNVLVCTAGSALGST